MRLFTIFTLFFAAVAIAAPSEDNEGVQLDLERCIRYRYDECIHVRSLPFFRVRGSTYGSILTW
jgi:hypothetical protein